MVESVRFRHTGVIVITLLVLALLSWAQAAVAVDDNAEKQPVRLTVSIHPLALIAEELLGDLATITEVFTGDSDPHHQSLSFSQVAAVRQADLVVWLGPQLEVPLVKQLYRKPNVLTLSEQLPIAGGHEPFEEDHQHSADLHIWMHPEQGVAIATAIAAYVGELYPQHRVALAQRLADFKARTAVTSANISEYLLSAQPIRFVADHDAFSYFSERFGLVQMGTLHDVSGVQIGPAAYLSLLQRAEVDCVIAESGANLARLERVSRQWGAQVVEVDPLGATMPLVQEGYQAYLWHLAESFAQCGNR